jgi:hypothetical protein
VGYGAGNEYHREVVHKTVIHLTMALSVKSVRERITHVRPMCETLKYYLKYYTSFHTVTK